MDIIIAIPISQVVVKIQCEVCRTVWSITCTEQILVTLSEEMKGH